MVTSKRLTQSTLCLGGTRKYVKIWTNGQKRHPVVTMLGTLSLTVSFVSAQESPLMRETCE